MKKIYLIVTTILFLSCKADVKFLRIDKYLNEDGFIGFRNLKNKLLQSNYYDKRHNLILMKNYSRSGCNLVDSITFAYNPQNRLVEKKHYTPVEVLDNCKSKFKLRDHILYKYNKKQELIVEVVKGVDIESLRKEDKNLSIALKDSLGLINGYLSDINLIVNSVDTTNAKSKVMNSLYVDVYTYNNIPSILMQYGIPVNEYLISATTYIKDNVLVKDEFNFKNYHLIRVYSYKNNILDNVIIETIRKSDRTRTKSAEKFITTME